MRATRALLLLAVLLLAPNGARAQDAVPPVAAPGEHAPTVVEVEFEGAVRLSPHVLRNRVRTRAGEPLVRETLAQDIARLHRTGEFEDGITVRTEAAGEGVLVVFTVRERALVSRVLFRGRDEVDEDDLEELVSTRAGEFVSPYLLHLDAERIRAKYREEGYLMCEVEPRLERGAEGGVDVVFRIREGVLARVAEIVLRGVANLEEDEVRAVLHTKESWFFGWLEAGLLDRVKLREDLDRVARLYRERGFLDAQVFLEGIDWSEDRSETVVTIRVVEGEPYRLRSLAITGLSALAESEVRSVLRLRAGDRFRGDHLELDSLAIRRLYSSRGYVDTHVGVDYAFDESEHELDLRFEVEEGERVRIERVLIRGNEKTQDQVIRRELTFYPGELFDSDQVEESLGRLNRNRYFSDLRIRLDPGSQPAFRDIVLEVEEARTGSLIIGGGISTNVGVFGNIALTQRNFDLFDPPRSLKDFLEGRSFTGAGQQLEIQLQPGRERSQYRVSFTEPWLLGWPIILSTDFFVFDRNFGDYFEGRLGGSLGLGYRLTPDLTVRATYRLERVRIYDVELDALPDVIAVSGNNYVSSLRLSVTYDRNLLDTQFVQYRGYAISVGYEYAGGPFGGDVDLSRATIEANWQTTLFELPVGGKHVFGIHAAFGWTEENRNTPAVPIFERFFAGGARSIRGFEFRTVGPQIRDKPTGGNIRILAGGEYSFPIPYVQDYLRGVLFVDSGTVEPVLDDIAIDRVRVSAGFGFRLLVPIFPAPVALDFGFPILDEEDDDEQVFSFSVGIGF